MEVLSVSVGKGRARSNRSEPRSEEEVSDDILIDFPISHTRVDDIPVERGIREL